MSTNERQMPMAKRSKADKTGLLLILLALVALGAVLFRWSTGSTLNALSGNDAENRGKTVSKKELAKLSRLMRIEIVSVRPNGSGFLIFSGTISNNGTEKVMRAGLAVRSIEKKIVKKGESPKATGRAVGEVSVEEIPAGGRKDFTIVTAVKASELDDYDLKVVGLEMDR